MRAHRAEIPRGYNSARRGNLIEGERRSILMARIRTDSTDAVVDLAQRVCVALDQKFVGVEVGGRYIRIYEDDTA